MLKFPSLERPIIHDILYRHVEDAAFFWQQRDQAVCLRDTYLEDIQTLDRKIQPHIQGVRAAGLAGWRSVLEELEHFTTAEEMFVAGSIAIFPPQNETLYFIVVSTLITTF